jgi:hypothetical protein
LLTCCLRRCCHAGELCSLPGCCNSLTPVQQPLLQSKQLRPSCPPPPPAPAGGYRRRQPGRPADTHSAAR